MLFNVVQVLFVLAYNQVVQWLHSILLFNSSFSKSLMLSQLLKVILRLFCLCHICQSRTELLYADTHLDAANILQPEMQALASQQSMLL